MSKRKSDSFMDSSRSALKAQTLTVALLLSLKGHLVNLQSDLRGHLHCRNSRSSSSDSPTGSIRKY